MEIKWKKIEELPINEEMYRKILLLVESDKNIDNGFRIITDFWHVFADSSYYDPSVYDKMSKKDEKTFYYGRLGERRAPIDKVKGWMFTKDLINLYYG